MARHPIPTWCFALVVVRRGDRFLLVREAKHGQRWYLPAGRVEPGETFEQAAIRETMEEAGVAIAVDGIVRIEHTPMRDGARLRVIYSAYAIGDATPKAFADEHSLGAVWVSCDELSGYELRGLEVRELFEHVARGGAVHALDVLGSEG